MALKFTGNYLNRYEYAHDLYQNNPYFNQQDWDTLSKRGDLDMYAAILNDSDKLPSYNDLSKEYRLDLMDTSTRFTLYANELYGNKENVDQKRTEDVYNDAGEVVGQKEYAMSDYEYTKKLLKEQNEARIKEEARRIAEQTKAENTNFFNNVLGWFAGASIDIMDVLQWPFQFVEGVLDGFFNLAEGKSWWDGFRSAFNDETSDMAIFDNVGWTDALRQWQIDYTDAYDLEGNPTNTFWGVTTQIAETIGGYLPSLGIGAGLKAIGVGAKAAIGIAQFFYYGGMAIDNMEEYASNDAYASIPTLTLLANSIMKAGAEYLVQKGLNKLMGPSAMDRLVFGMKGGVTSKISGWTALKGIGKDALHEGFEEYLQQYADWFVDQAFSVMHSEFRFATDISTDALFNAFLLGALSSIGTATLQVASSTAQDIKARIKGKYVFTWNPLKSYSFKQVMADMATQYQTVMKDKKMDLDTKRAVAGQMFVNYQTLAQFYGVVGKERFNQAVEVLNRVNSYNGEFAEMNVKAFVNTMMQRVQEMPGVALEALKEVIKNAKLADELATIDEDTDIADLPQDVKESAVTIAKEIIANDKDVKEVVYTKKGSVAVKAGDKVIVPIQMTETLDAKSIGKSANETDIVTRLLSAPGLSSVIDSIEDLYKQVYGTDTTLGNTRVLAVYDAIFNPKFRAVIWGVANQDLYKFMTYLQDYIKAARKGQKGDAPLTRKITAVMKDLQKELIQFCITQTNAQFDELTILTDEQKEYIHNHRYNIEMFKRLLNNQGNLNDKTVIRQRINSAPVKQNIKDDILKKIESDKQSVRLSGLRELDTIYNHQWTSPYDGTKYLPNNSIPNNLMNSFMKDMGIDLTMLNTPPVDGYPAYEQILYEKGRVDAQTTLAWYRDQFKMYSNNQFDFTIVDGKVVITELDKENQFGYKRFSQYRQDIYEGEYNSSRRTIVRTTAGNLIAPYLNKGIDDVTRAGITVTDAVYNPSYLSRNTKSDIYNKYGKVTPQTTFLYLRDMFLDKTKGEITIVMRNDGSFVFANVAPMKEVLKKQTLTEKDLSVGEHKLSDFVQAKHLPGILKDTKVVIAENHSYGYYSPDDNTIYLDVADTDFMTFALLHEFQHAIQLEEGLMGGLSTDWLSTSIVSKKAKDAIVADIKKHRPELFKGKPVAMYQQIAEQFVYDTTGEAYAYGLGREWDVIDFYPTYARDTGRGTIEIVLPWGSRYTMTYNTTTKQSIVDRSTKTALLTNIYTAADGTQFRLQQTVAVNYPGGGGIILQDGTIFGSYANNIHDAVFKKVKLDEENIIRIRKIDAFNTRSGYPEYEIMLNENLSKAEYFAVAELLRALHNRGYKVKLCKVLRDKNGIATGQKTVTADFTDTDGFGVLENNGITDTQVYNRQMMANDQKKKLLDYPVYREINEWFKQAMPDREMQPNSLCGLILPDGTVAYTSQYWTHLDVTRAAATYFAPTGKDVKIDKFNNHVVEIALNGRFGNGFQDSVSVRINGAMNIDQQEALTNFIDDALMHGANIEIEHKPTGVYITADESQSGREVMRDLKRFVNMARGRVNNVPENKVYTREDPKPAEPVVTEQTVKPVEQPKVEEPKVEEQPKVKEPKVEEQPKVEEPKVVEEEPKKESVRPKRTNVKYKNKTETTNKKGQTVYKYEYTHNTYVSNEEARKTNLKYFIRKNRPIQMGQDMQYFVINANKYNVPEHLWNKIEQGTLTRRDIMDELRTADEMDNNTFQLINDAFFQNEHVKSFKQMKNFTEGNAMAEYYALRAVMRKVGLVEETMFKLSREAIYKIVNDWLKLPDIKRMYDKIILRYSSFNGKPIVIDRNAARVTFMKYFDGSVNSLAKTAGIAKYIAVNGWDVAGQVKTTGETKKASSQRHQDELEFGIEETVADQSAEDMYEAVDSKLDDMNRTQMRQAVLNYFAEQVRGKNLGLTKTAMIEAVKDLSDEQLRNFYAKIEVSDIVAKPLSETEMDKIVKGEDKPIVKPRKSYLQSMYQTSATIRNNLSPKDKKKFLEAHGDIFTDDLRVRPELYKDKSYDEVKELAETIRKISADVRKGIYASKTAAKIAQSLEYWRKRAKAKSVQELRNQANGQRNYAEQKLIFDNVEFVIDSTIEIPPVLKKILDTSFEQFAKTNVKYLTEEGEVHIKLNLQKFEQDNIQRFAQFTDKDVEDIVEYYSHALLVGKTNEESMRKFNAFKIYTLAYLHKLGTDGVIHVSADQLTRIDDMLRVVASGAGTDLAVFRSVLKVLNPNKAIVQSIAKSANIEFREEDIDRVAKAAKSGDVKAIERAMDNLYKQGLKLYTGDKKAFLDKLWKFQRMAMLSSPGTWIRNIVSNSLVSAGNSAGTVIGNLFLRKHKQGQYKLTGKSPIKLSTTRVNKEWRNFGKIKVDNKYARFIKEQIIDSGLMNLTTEGLNKYDIRKMDKDRATSQDILTELIVNSVVTKIFNQNQFDTKFMNNVGKALFTVLSDDPWINRRTISYLGKMLQEDGADVSQGLTEDILKAYAEAYTLAAWDYMHRPNFFTNIEYGIRRRAGVAGYYMYKQLLPFATAGWNWFMEGLNYTPVGLAKGIIQYARLEKTIDRMEAARQAGDNMPSSRFAEYLAKRTFGKGIIGTIGLMIGIGLGIAGIAGVDEDDEKLKLKLGDLYVDISDLFGTSSILVGIAMTNPWKNKDENFGDKFWNAMTQTFDQLFMDSTFSDLYNEFEYTYTFADWLLQQPVQVAATFVPNILKTFNGLLYNHKIKYSSGVLAGFESFVIQSIPGIAYAFPRKVDPYTGETKQKYNVPFIFDFINRMGPIDFKPYSVSDVQREAIARGVAKTELTGKYKDIGELSNRDKQRLNEAYGQMNNRDLKKLYNDQIVMEVEDENGKRKNLRYSQMSNEQKKSAIERIMSDNAKIAKIYIYTSNGGKYYATDSEWTSLRSEGIVQNVYRETAKLKGFK